MNAHFNTVMFTTYEEGKFSAHGKKPLMVLKALFIIGMILAVIYILSLISIYIGIIIPFLFFPILKIYFSQKGAKEVLTFIKNGTLIISDKGLSIDQKETIFIPLSIIKQIVVDYDRPDPLELPSKYRSMYKTYKITISYDIHKTTLYVEKEADLGFRKVYGNIIETLNALRKVNYNLYKCIKFNCQ